MSNWTSLDAAHDLVMLGITNPSATQQRPSHTIYAL
jgi:hypothetical protein